MEILGLSPVLVTIAICIIGVSYRIITGMAGKSWSEFNPTIALTTFMLGIVTSIGLVAPIIDALPDDMSATLQMAAIGGQVLVVMGLDAGVRKGQKVAEAAKKKKSDSTHIIEIPEETIEELPPGKIR